MRRSVWVKLIVLCLLALLPLIGMAQQEDVDTDTATLILNIERAVSIQVTGGPITVTLGPAELARGHIPLGEFRLAIDSFTDYRVLAYGTVIPADIDIGAVQMRVERIAGPFTQLAAPDFMPLGTSTKPLELFSGGNNLGIGTTAILGLQLDLGRLRDSLKSDSYTFTLAFMVVER